MADTRKDRRAPVSLKVRFKSATVDEFVEQYAIDISRGGIFIKSKSPMPVGTLLKFEFQLKDESRLIHGVGRVVWKRDADGTESEAKPPGMGIKFIKMDPASRALVEQIAAQRGATPGSFDEGSAPGVAASSMAPSRPVKKTEPFFPSPLPKEQLPAAEDSTQVRHASEFLAEALSAGDEESAKEAAARAEDARRRTDQIQRERAAQVVRDKDAAETQRVEEERAAEEQRAAAEQKATADRQAAEQRRVAETDQALRRMASEPGLDEMLAQETAGARAAVEAEERERAQRAAFASAAERAVASEPPPPPEGRSKAIPIAIGFTAAAAVGFLVWSQMSGGNGTDETPTANTPPVEEASADPATAEGEGETAEGEAAEALAAEGEAPAPTPEPAATPVAVRIESTPPGATILVNGEERGITPTSVELPLGRAASVAVQLEGHVTGTEEVTAAEGQAPIAFELRPMPWVILVAAEPATAHITATGGRTNPAGELVLRARPRGPINLTATADGFTRATKQLLVAEFQADGERMVAHVTWALTPTRRGGGWASMASAMTIAETPTMTVETPTMTVETPAMTETPVMVAETPTMTTQTPTMTETPAMTVEPPTMDTAGGGETGPVPDNPFE